MTQTGAHTSIALPAPGGIHGRVQRFTRASVDPGLRRDDGAGGVGRHAVSAKLFARGCRLPEQVEPRANRDAP